MLVVYAIVVGLVAGLLLGGRIEGLGRLELRWLPVIVAGFAVQFAIFGPLDATIGAAGPPLYVGSTAAVLAAMVRNIRIPGLALVAIGAASNLVAILANGGIMPADAGAVALAGLEADGGFSNSAIVAAPALRPLTDIFAMPAGFPLANVFSVGDVLIAAGLAITIAVAMRSDRGAVRPGTSYD